MASLLGTAGSSPVRNNKAPLKIFKMPWCWLWNFPFFNHKSFSYLVSGKKPTAWRSNNSRACCHVNVPRRGVAPGSAYASRETSWCQQPQHHRPIPPSRGRDVARMTRGFMPNICSWLLRCHWQSHVWVLCSSSKALVFVFVSCPHSSASCSRTPRTPWCPAAHATQTSVL